MAEALNPPTLTFYGERMTWVSPASLEELVQLRNRFPGAPLVIGNTSIGLLEPVVQENHITNFKNLCLLTYKLKKVLMRENSHVFLFN